MVLRKLVLNAACAGLGLAAASVALAQPQAPKDPNMPDPNGVPAEKMRPAEPGKTGETLSDTLQRQDGVIPPKPTGDADITVKPPVPNPGTTIVIPPPGTSPADPVQPK